VPSLLGLDRAFHVRPNPSLRAVSKVPDLVSRLRYSLPQRLLSGPHIPELNGQLHSLLFLPDSCRHRAVAEQRDGPLPGLAGSAPPRL